MQMIGLPIPLLLIRGNQRSGVKFPKGQNHINIVKEQI